MRKENENGIDLISIRVMMNPSSTAEQQQDDKGKTEEDTLNFHHRIIDLAKQIVILKKDIL